MQAGGTNGDDAVCLQRLAADLRGRMEAWQERAPQTSSTPSECATLDGRSPLSPDRKATITSIVNESLEQFRITLSQEHVRTVDLVKHWAKVASESKRVCSQIAEKLQGSDPCNIRVGEYCTTPAVEAMLREGLQEAVEGLRSEFKGAFDDLESSILSKAVAAISSDAKSSVQKAAAAALDKVLEVEGSTLEAWTREFDYARSELSRQAGQLSSLEARITKQASLSEDDLAQQTQFASASGDDGNTGSSDAMCLPSPRGALGQLSDRSSIPKFDEIGDQIHALGTRLLFVEDSMATILNWSNRQSMEEASLRVELEELRSRIQTLVPSEMEAALERLQQLQGPSIALRQQLERMIEDNKETWLIEMASRQEVDNRVETACENKLTNLEMSLLELSRKIQDQADILSDMEKTISIEHAERDEKQQAFSEAVQTTLKMLIEKMDDMNSGSAQLYSPAPPPAPFPIRRSPEASVAGVPSPILGRSLITSVRRITSAPVYHPSIGTNSTLSRSSSDKLLSPSETSGEGDTTNAIENVGSGAMLSTSSTAVPGTPDVVLSGGGGTVSSVPCTEAVHKVGIPEDEPVLWAPRSGTSERARSLSPVCAPGTQANSMEDTLLRNSAVRSPLGFSSRALQAVSDEPLTQPLVFRRMASLSPGRMSRSPVPPQLVPVGTSTSWASSRSVPTARPTSASSSSIGVSSRSAETSRPRSSSPNIFRTSHLCSPSSAIHSAASSASAPVSVALASPLSPHRHDGIRTRSGTARFSSSLSSSAPASATAPATMTRVSSSPKRNCLIPSALPSGALGGVPSAVLGPRRNSIEVGPTRQSLSPSPQRQRDQATVPANVAAVLLPLQSSHH